MLRPVAIDIGTSSIKLIELQEKKGKLELLNCGINAVSGEDIKTSLKDLLALAKPYSKRVNISLSGPSVTVRYIEMPPMKKEELRSAIKFEGAKHVPFDINDAIVDSAVLDKNPSGSANRVLLVAAKKDRIKGLLDMFKEMGMDIANIDVDTMALFNSFQRLGLENKHENAYAMVNIGARFSNVNIAAKGHPYFTRDIMWGGADISARIKEQMAPGQEEAEKLKREPGEKKADVARAITPVLERFVSEMRMSFDYFETQFGRNVERLYISGGTAYLFNIRDFLKENLGMEAALWNPFEGIKVHDEAAVDKSASDFPGRFSVAMGLALRK
ncbi:MAG: type IV pilus assembly protein PilM [Candidatus Omnitrophota bacterium]|jgi:type IV pilus assembly protein PilM